jgi:hypothetical protein
LFAVGAGVEGWCGKGTGGQEGNESKGGMHFDVFIWLLEEGSRRRIVSRKYYKEKQRRWVGRKAAKSGGC